MQFAVVIAFIAWRDTAAPGTVDMAQLANDGFLLAFVTIAGRPGLDRRVGARGTLARLGVRATTWRWSRRGAARSLFGDRVSRRRCWSRSTC